MSPSVLLSLPLLFALSACQGEIAATDNNDPASKLGELSVSTGGSSCDVGGTGGIGGSASVGAAGMSGSGGTSGSGGDTSTVTGWTPFTAQTGSRTIYVSNSGNDAWPGTETQPKATIQAGYSMLRDGQADWLMLQRGGNWNLSMFQWSKSGPSAVNAGSMRLGAYGNESLARPRINTGTGSGIVITPGYRGTRPISNLAFTDVHVVAQGRLDARASAGSASGLQTVAVEYQGAGLPFQHLLLENLRIEGFSMGFVSASDLSDLRVRRCIITEIFLPGGSGTHSSGMIVNGVDVLLEENVFYRIQHPSMPSVSAISYYAHSVYIGAEARNVVSRGNIIIKTTEGLMQRPGGIYERNVSASNDMATSIGMAWGVRPTVGGVASTVQDNLYLNAVADLTLGNTRSGTVRNNLLLRGPEGTSSFGNVMQGRVEIRDGQNQLLGVNVGVHNVRFENNKLAGDFTYAGASSSDTNSFSGLTFVGNSTRLGPTSTTLSSFLSSVGLSGDIDSYGRDLLTRDRATFRQRHRAETMINYYRAPFGMAPLN